MCLDMFRSWRILISSTRFIPLHDFQSEKSSSFRVGTNLICFNHVLELIRMFECTWYVTGRIPAKKNFIIKIISVLPTHLNYLHHWHFQFQVTFAAPVGRIYTAPAEYPFNSCFSNILTKLIKIQLEKIKKKQQTKKINNWERKQKKVSRRREHVKLGKRSKIIKNKN